MSDLITGIDGQVVDDPNAFDYRFATRPLGGTAQIDIVRSGKPQKLTIALETAPDAGRNEIVIKSRSPVQGAKVSNISPAVKTMKRCFGLCSTSRCFCAPSGRRVWKI